MKVNWKEDFPTYISLPNTISEQLPTKYDFQDVRYTSELVRYFLQRYTVEGERVLDPFLGFGTTLMVADDMDREGWGIEIDSKKVKYLQEELGISERLVHGDIKRLFLEKNLPLIDCIMTSPPYMGREDSANALSGYRYAGKYQQYLSEMEEIFIELKKVLREDAVIIVEISNLKQENSRTTLAWDVGSVLSSIFEFRGEVIVAWTGEREESKQGIYNYGYDHSYCLIYSNSREL